MRVVTAATFHAPRFWLNAAAPLNACEPTARRIAQSPRGTRASTAASGDAPPAQAPETSGQAPEAGPKASPQPRTPARARDGLQGSIR
jgi:hypothetical protein